LIHQVTIGTMIDIADAMGLAPLDALDDVIAANRRHSVSSAAALRDVPGLGLLRIDGTERHNYQYVVVEVDTACPASRDELLQALHAENVIARRYFWPGCHNMEPYRSLFPHAGLVLPHTDTVAARVLVLPTGQTMDSAMVETVVRILQQRIAQAAG
jgi:dTDP-4-amino-4,6-dideoxygalactose transaminase